MDYKKDYYKILEINRDVSKEEIRASFRRLAKKYHPDRNAGDAIAEENFKLVNEAHETLSNDILRTDYDEYWAKLEEWEKKQQEKDKTESASIKNKKTYQRKKTVTTETRIYIKGEIRIKYYGDPEEFKTGAVENEFRYKITPNEAEISVEETNIHPINGIPLEYLKAYKESELFKSPIPQPVTCIIKTSSGDEIYKLDLREIRIKNIRFENVTKHEKQSFGTLIGRVYAYNPKFSYHEEIEEVTECFGETGNHETKTEGEDQFYRKEYYNPDCSTYWGEWHKVQKPKSAATQHTGFRTRREPVFAEMSGCLQWWWVPLLVLFCIIYPQFLIGLLVIIGLSLLFAGAGYILGAFRRILPILGLGLLFFLLFNAFRSLSWNTTPSYINSDKPSYDSLSSTIVPIKKDPGDTSSTSLPDTLISHFIKWKDYNDSSYATTLSVLASDVRSSIAYHNSMDPYFEFTSLTPAYNGLLQQDQNKLNRVYTVFDSIRNLYNLDELQFAQMIVSCVQSIPYFLVVDQNCTDSYDDQFTVDYLANCKSDCCVGNEKFGVRSPTEFLSDLKGDCDTRAVFLYNILKKYNYNVSIITSDYYKHAMIAVNFKNHDNLPGLSLSIKNKNYYLWETTSAGLDVGQIPTYLQNLDYWDIALLNQND